MEKQIRVEIESITREEYIQAGSASIRRMALPLFGLVAVLTVIIALAIQDFSVRSILVPFLIALAALVVFEVMVITSWRRFPADTAFSYLIDETGWQLTMGEETVKVEWDETARLTIRSHAILLYNETNRSNLLPRRCVTQEQIDWMKELYRASRKEYKLLQKEKENMEREKSRKKRAETRSNRGGFRR